MEGGRECGKEGEREGGREGGRRGVGRGQIRVHGVFYRVRRISRIFLNIFLKAVTKRRNASHWTVAVGGLMTLPPLHFLLVVPGNALSTLLVRSWPGSCFSHRCRCCCLHYGITGFVGR